MYVCMYVRMYMYIISPKSSYLIRLISVPLDGSPQARRAAGRSTGAMPATRPGRVTFDGDEDGWEHEPLGHGFRRGEGAAQRTCMYIHIWLQV